MMLCYVASLLTEASPTHWQSGLLGLVYGEMRAVRELGLAVDVEAYLARFPDLVEPLRHQIEEVPVEHEMRKRTYLTCQ